MTLILFLSSSLLCLREGGNTVSNNSMLVDTISCGKCHFFHAMTSEVALALAFSFGIALTPPVTVHGSPVLLREKVRKGDEPPQVQEILTDFTRVISGLCPVHSTAACKHQGH